MGDVGARVLAAIPAIIFACLIVAYGGLVFAIGLIVLGFICLHELYTMTARVRPVKLAGFLGLAAVILSAHFGDEFHILLALVATVPVTFLLSLARPGRENVSWAIAVTLLGVLWIGVALALAVQLRELDHGGALVVATLFGTFLGDTAAYFGGRAWGRRPMAPLISPNKTLEGLICGVAGGAFMFWLFMFAWHDWIAGADALIIGVCVAVMAPFGDLFESLLKRDLEVKDTGKVFGAHGGALDRLDAVFFTAVTAYFVSLAVL